MFDEIIRREFTVYVMAVVIFVGAFFWAVREIAGCLKAIFKIARERDQRNRGRRMLKRARLVGQLVVMNSEKWITAVCSRREFINSLLTEEKRIASELESMSESKVRMFTSPRMVMPTPIFTFAEADQSNPCVTGTTIAVKLILEDLILKVTGYKKAQVSSADFERATNILVGRDRRLIVPFIREGHLPDGSLLPSLASQVATYGGHSVATARQYILDLV